MSKQDPSAGSNSQSGGEDIASATRSTEISSTQLLDSAAVEAEIGRSIGPYKLLEKVGEGGFGVVFVAEQREPIKRRVALKIIKVGMDTREVVARFEAERQALAMMDHPNIAKVLDAGATESGRPFFAMELVRGIKITSYCDQHRLSTRARLELCIQVCQAVQHAHQKGIIHRDIKPSNIMITLHDGVPVPKVIDFGIAKATQQELTNKTVYTQLHQFIGTPSYMSPEQAEMSGLDIDTRSDIYSLGVLIYEILTGRPPFDGKELLKRGLDEMIRTIREDEPKRPSTQVSEFTEEELSTAARRRGVEATNLVRQLRGDLDWVVMKCLEKDRTRRYETANALASDLRRYQSNELVTARPASAGYRARKWVRRNKVATVTAGLVLLSLMGALVFSTAALLREKQAREREALAERKKLAESVRAESVGNFLQELITTVAPTLVDQGDKAAVRELLSTTERLALTVLSNSPATEIGLQYQIAREYSHQFAEPTNQAANYARIAQLLPLVPKEKLPVPLDKLRVDCAAGAWNGRFDQLHALENEFGSRTPPDWLWVARCLYQEGNWFLDNGNAAEAKKKLAEASRVMPRGASLSQEFGIAMQYGSALCDLGEWSAAITVLESGLRPWTELSGDLWERQQLILEELPRAYCALERLDDLLALLRTQENAAISAGVHPSVIYNVRKARVHALAQGRRPREALELATALSTNSHAVSRDCIWTGSLAAGVGDINAYRNSCGLVLARYTSSQEGFEASQIGRLLLAHPQGPAVLRAVEELLDRVDFSKDYSIVNARGLRGFLMYRRGKFAEAIEHFHAEPVAFKEVFARHARIYREFANWEFQIAMTAAQLGRVNEAQQAFSKGLKVLERTESGARRVCLGEDWLGWNLMNAARMEAEQVFRAKGIAVPSL